MKNENRRHQTCTSGSRHHLRRPHPYKPRAYHIEVTRAYLGVLALVLSSTCTLRTREKSQRRQCTAASGVFPSPHSSESSVLAGSTCFLNEPESQDKPEVIHKKRRLQDPQHDHRVPNWQPILALITYLVDVISRPTRPQYRTAITVRPDHSPRRGELVFCDVSITRHSESSSVTV